MYMGQIDWGSIATAIPQIAQTAQSVVQAFQPPPAGVTPMYPPPVYMPPPQQRGAFGIDPMTLALIVGGGVLIFLIAKK